MFYLNVVSECDILDITSGDLALLQDSHNIEFVVEDDDEDQACKFYFLTVYEEVYLNTV